MELRGGLFKAGILTSSYYQYLRILLFSALLFLAEAHILRTPSCSQYDCHDPTYHIQGEEGKKLVVQNGAGQLNPCHFFQSPNQ